MPRLWEAKAKAPTELLLCWREEGLWKMQLQIWLSKGVGR